MNLHGTLVAATVLLLGAASVAAQEPDAEPDLRPKAPFVPGSQLLFFEDFSTAAGAKPLARLSNATERMATGVRDGAPYLHVRPPATFELVFPEPLPERFTIELDYNIAGPNGVVFFLVPPGEGGGQITCASHHVAAGDMGGDARSIEIDRIDGLGSLEESVAHCSIAVDGDHVRMYVNQLPVLDVPRSALGRSNRLYVEFVGGTDADYIDQNAPVWLTNLRIATGGAALSFAELEAKGRLVTQGILFDFGSDRIRPESTPTLDAIAQLLREHPDVRLTVEGHTDNVGAAAANQTLSERRAAAVKAALVGSYGIAATRLESAGLGASRPAASNDTSEGRQTNRRVELVRL